MYEIKNGRLPLADNHREYIYKDGKKFPKADSGLRYVYIDKSGVLQISKHEDTASFFGGGVYLVVTTDYANLGSNNDKIHIDGKVVEIHGEFEDRKGKGVYLKNATKHYIKCSENIEVIYPTKGDEYAKAYKMYTDIINGGERVYENRY